ncbi:Uncharacterised protein at_DN0556 [Pycnogonum litorale]
MGVGRLECFLDAIKPKGTKSLLDFGPNGFKAERQLCLISISWTHARPFEYHGVSSLGSPETVRKKRHSFTQISHPHKQSLESKRVAVLLGKNAKLDIRGAFLDGSAVFQQDLARRHMSKVVTSFFERNKSKSVGPAREIAPAYRKSLVYHRGTPVKKKPYHKD